MVVHSADQHQQAKTAFIASLTDLAESEIDREPLLLSRDRGKAATLIQGAVDRGDIYKSVEANIDALIAEHIIHVEQAAREIRRHEVGGDVAAEEERLGNKTEEEYTKEATVRRQAREKVRKQDEARKRREEEKERLRAEEKMKMLELEKLRTADERRRDHEAREEKRKREREAQRAVEKQLEEERELQRRERYEMRKKEEKEREREREWEWEREREQEMERERDSDRHRGRDRSRDYAGSSYRDLEDIPWGGDESVRRSRSRPQEQEMTPLLAPEVDEKALEEAALELLLKEGRELAAKSGPRTELERSESLEPPPRKSQLSKSKLSEPSTPKPTTDDRKSTPKPETRISSKTSYSNVTRQPAPTPADLTDLTPHHRSDRSASSAHDPYSRPRHPSRSRSRSRTRYSSRWDSEKRKADAEAKQAWKEQAVRQREREAEAWKRAAREGRDFTECRTRSRSPTRDAEREKERSNHHRHRHSRSRSPKPRSRYERERERERECERSRSPRARKGYQEGAARSSARKSKSPVEIDRYVPGGSGRTRPGRSDEKAGRSDERAHRSDGRSYRTDDRAHRTDDRSHRTAHRPHTTHDRPHHRADDRPRDRDRDWDDHRYVDIDRYVPSPGTKCGDGPAVGGAAAGDE